LSIRLDAVLETVKLPTGIADLNTGLANVDRNALPHCRWLKPSKPRIKPLKELKESRLSAQKIHEAERRKQRKIRELREDVCKDVCTRAEQKNQKTKPKD
jgi:hypothetical protein